MVYKLNIMLSNKDEKISIKKIFFYIKIGWRLGLTNKNI